MSKVQNSKEHPVKDSTEHTGEEVEGDANEQPETNDAAESSNYEKRYKDLQRVYTEATQKLASMEKEKDSGGQVSTGDVDDQREAAKQAAQLLKPFMEEWFASKKDNELEKFLSANPDMATQRKLLETLSTHPSNTGKSYWDLAAENNLKSPEKLEKAKASNRVLAGNTSPDMGKPQPLISASTEEYEEWKKANLGKTSPWKTS